MTAEATLRGAVLKRINEDYPRRSSGVLVFGRPAGPSTGPGHPDLFGVALSRFFALEIKVLKAKPTPLQIQRIKDLRQAGAYAWIIRTPLEASKAVYQAKMGVNMTKPEDPIDFDDWFKEITTQPASMSDKAEPSTEADAAALDEALDLEATADPNAQAVSLSAEEVASTGAVAEPAPVTRTRRGRGKPTVAEVTANNRVTPDVPSAEALAEYLPTEIQAAADADQSLAYVVELVKAVGDRVTEVWEVAMRVDAKQDLILDRLHKLQVDFDTLLEDES